MASSDSAWRGIIRVAITVAVLLSGSNVGSRLRAADPDVAPVPERVYRGELVSYPGPWGFLPQAHIILVSDAELRDLAADPDKKLNLAMTFAPRVESLREICQRAQSQGQQTLVIAFDHFFAQYRPGQHKPRELTPDIPEYIQLIAQIGKFAEQFGLGLELSLLSPLEIGPAYARATGESGLWMHYRKGLRDPHTGQFSVQLWRQRRWTNNKGPIDVQDAGVRVFAFRQRKIPGTPYRVVKPEDIIEISDNVQVDVWPDVKTGVAERIRVHGLGHTDIGPLDRVLVVQQYRTPEMDYFSKQALPYLKELVDNYATAGVKLHGLYSDEMHIQQDWAYFNHHDHGEFAVRYVSPGLARTFAEQYGEQYRDLAKYLVYFARGQEDTESDLSAKQGVMHVWGDSAQAIQETALFRARYYRLLQNGVVDLFVAAKRYAEQRAGHRLMARAHATWAESPTIDCWETDRQPRARYQYEYTSNFVWSCTVHQAASACADYFKWGDFLTGGGNDHAEGGWLDRNYYAIALACSTGILNEVPYSYAAHWGMPAEVHQRRTALASTFGAGGMLQWGLVQDMEHRDVEVLMLYPLDLVAVDERYGSWMTQYGYANYITQEKLLEHGRVTNGGLEVAGRHFTTLVALFEPFPSRQLLDLMQEFVAAGGRVVWSGPPPALTWEGEPALPVWEQLFGARYAADLSGGQRAPGQLVEFEGALAGVAAQTVLTDFLVDRLYPVEALESAVVVARSKGQVVGTLRQQGAGGATFLGYRPRDDQSRSLGYEMRNWFEVLHALDAYSASGKFEGVNDNPQVVSRTTDVLACQFPNGAVALARHLRVVEEGWPGGFARKAEDDARYMQAHPLPDDTLTLTDFPVAGHRVTYAGKLAVTFRMDSGGNLVALAATGGREIAIDGRQFVFADAPWPLVAWAPVPETRRVAGGAIVQAMVIGQGTLRIPRVGIPDGVAVYAEGAQPGSRGQAVPAVLEADHLSVPITANESGRWLWVVPE